MPKIFKDKIIFDIEDWTSTLDPQFDMGGLWNEGKMLSSVRTMNPYRYLGGCAPGFQQADVSNVSVVDSLILKGIVSGNDAYLVSQGSKLHKVQNLSTTPALVTPTTFPHTIAHGAHTGETGNDIVIYTAKVGGISAERVFYSFTDDTDWDVGTYDLATTFDDDFMSTAPATPLGAPYLTGGKDDPHPMMVNDRDVLLIGDRNFVHEYDGQGSDADGNFSANVLQLPNGYIITTFEKYNQYTVIFAYKKVAGSNRYAGEARAFFWDNLSLDITYSKNLNDNYVSEAFQYRGTIGCFTQGTPSDPIGINSKVTKILLFDETEFKPIKAIDKNPPIRGGVDIQGDVIYWNSQGTIYSYGSPFDELPKGLNATAEGQGAVSGMCKTLSKTQFISTGTTTAGGLQTLGSNYNFQTLFYTGLAKPQFPIGMQGKVERVVVNYIKTSSAGRKLGLVLRDKSSDLVTVFSESDSVSVITSDNIKSEYKDLTAKFKNMRLAMQYHSGTGITDAPIISSVEVYFSLTNL